MGGNDIVTPEAIVGGDTLASRVMDELEHHEADYDGLEAAFAHQWISFHAPITQEEDRQLSLLRRASVLDPKNRLYSFKIATLLFERGNSAEAEALLGAIVDDEMSAGAAIWRMPLIRVAMSHTADGQTLLLEREMIARAGKSGHGNAALLAAVSYAALGEHDRARSMVAIARRVMPSNRAVGRVSRFLLGRAMLTCWLQQPFRRWLIDAARQIARRLRAAIGRG